MGLMPSYWISSVRFIDFTYPEVDTTWLALAVWADFLGVSRSKLSGRL